MVKFSVYLNRHVFVMTGLDLLVSGKEIFKVFPIWVYVKQVTPRACHFWPQTIIWTIVVKAHLMKLHAKYPRPRPSCFRQEDFDFSYFMILCKTSYRPRWVNRMRVRLEIRRSRVRSSSSSTTFFRRDWSWNIFYGHSLPSANSRQLSVSVERMCASTKPVLNLSEKKCG